MTAAPLAQESGRAPATAPPETIHDHQSNTTPRVLQSSRDEVLFASSSSWSATRGAFFVRLALAAILLALVALVLGAVL